MFGFFCEWPDFSPNFLLSFYLITRWIIFGVRLNLSLLVYFKAKYLQNRKVQV